MKKSLDYTIARDMLLGLAATVGTETVPLELCGGRIIAQSLKANENVPAFDRSPYDGYAVRSGDCAAASATAPVTLRILEEVPAGAVPTIPVTPGTATKILTGAPLPEGADAVIMYERTSFTAETVTLTVPVKSGENIVRAGEDVKIGQTLIEPGAVIDAGLAGTLAAQGVAQPLVYRRPLIGLISTGSELVEPGGEVPAGKIRNSNRYTLTAALQKVGCNVEYLGAPGDETALISGLITQGLDRCDAVLLTGGVSAGDYDLTPAAMEASGVEILVRGVKLKPGMACALGIKDGRLVCGLSGNPASSMTNYYAVILPAIRKLAGYANPMPTEIGMVLASDFGKPSKGTRLLRGTIELADGTVKMRFAKDQGNVVISSAIGCDAMAIIPAGSGPISAGTILRGFLI